MGVGIHNRKTNRLKGYDYTTPGSYYVTICAKNRIENANVFGRIENKIMNLNQTGLIAQKQWEWISEQYNHIKHDEWIIMPDHIHGIIEILQINGDHMDVGDDRRRDRSRPVPTIPTSKIKPLDQIIGAFKTTSSKMIHQSGNNTFAWHRSFYDHIIRDKTSLTRIRKYIRNNPIKWESKHGDDPHCDLGVAAIGTSNPLSTGGGE